MANILINGMKSKVGGGKAILDGYLKMLACNPLEGHHYYVLTPNRAAYRQIESSYISVIDVPFWSHHNLAVILLYRIILPLVIKKFKIDAILNFGDIVIPSHVPQVYNFDWAFAIYKDDDIWNRIKGTDRLIIYFKLLFFKSYLSYATTVMAQTDAMKSRLERRYGLTNVVLVPAAIDCSLAGGEGGGADLIPSSGDFKVIYPANYYPHKNIEVLEQVAELIRSRGLPIKIITTLSTGEHVDAARFLRRCQIKGLDSIIINVGRLPGNSISALFQSMNALLMPTLLETFGLPYAEAMHHGKPILTSDRDFSRAVCGDAALYFDPHEAASIVNVMEQLVCDSALYGQLVELGRLKYAGMWDWQKVYAEYQRQLSVVLNRSL